MSADLVFVHGRSQQNKDAATLKHQWLAALTKGLEKSGIQFQPEVHRVHFPYYGDTLWSLVQAKANVPDVIIKGSGASDPSRQLQGAVIEELRQHLKITHAEIRAELSTEGIEKGPLNWEWVQAILTLIDRRIPGGSALALGLATRDVNAYLRNPGFRDRVETGVRLAITPGVPTVIVGHSLGSVVAYNLLRREGSDKGWIVPLLVTIGSPLAITAIRKAVGPNKFPECVDAWYNAMDPRDVVSLYPLDTKDFPLESATRTIENNAEVRNWTHDRHGIEGYLDDAAVAQRINAALAT